MPRPILSKSEREVRLRNYQRRYPDDQLLRYLVIHHEVITRIYQKTGGVHLVLPTVQRLGLLDSHGNQVTLAVLRYTWYRLNRVLERIEQFDKISDYVPKTARKGSPTTPKKKPSTRKKKSSTRKQKPAAQKELSSSPEQPSAAITEMTTTSPEPTSTPQELSSAPEPPPAAPVEPPSASGGPLPDPKAPSAD